MLDKHLDGLYGKAIGIDSDIDESTLEATIECLEYRETRGAMSLEELWMAYNGHGMAGAETEFAGLTERYLPRLRELVKGSVSLYRNW